MTNEIKNKVLEIDTKIRQHKWFDFQVINYDGFKLTVAGSVDLTNYHSLEIIFEDIFFVSGFFRGWHSNTKQITFLLPDDEKKMNEKYEIEQGYQLFIFKTEDYSNDVLIAAKHITFNTETVFYYDRSDLKENERVADFVKKKKNK